MDWPKPIEDLIESFMLLPSVGKKTAERFALYCFSNMNQSALEKFSTSFINLKKGVCACKICGNLSTNDICDICSNPKRDKSTIMVCENVKDLFVLEKLGQYNGVYHVLGGAIDFSKGIGVEDIHIKELIDRVKDGNVKEVILASNATLQGETTARYIKTLLEDYSVLVTRLAHGLPIGGDISYADEMTVLKALEGRNKY